MTHSPIETPSHTFTLTAAKITRTLAAIAAFLVLTSGVVSLSELVSPEPFLGGTLASLFQLDSERNLPTFYTVLLLLLAAFLLLLITLLNRRQKAPDGRYWAVLAAGFFFMAYDEGTAVHEQLAGPARELIKENATGLLYLPWVVFAIPLVLLLGIFFLRFVRRLPAATRRRFIIAALLYLGGAIALEMLGATVAESWGSLNVTYKLLVILEEGLEIFGVIAFIRALLLVLAERFGTVQFEIIGKPHSNP